jgi:membrane-associated phospholipid phosphatase
MKPLKFLTDRAMWHISALGSAIFMILLILFYFFLGKSRLSFALLIGLLIVFAVTVPIKLLHYKERPKRRSFSNWIEKIDASSFPSIHANRASLIFVIMSFYFWSIPMAMFLFAISILVSYSRIYLSQHYTKDVIFGYVFGLIEGALIVFLA